MFCSECGKEIANNSKFCPECGENLSSDSSSKTKPVDETRDTRKMPIFGLQCYTLEERKDPRNKKKGHIWYPLIPSNQSGNYQLPIITVAAIVFFIIVLFVYGFS